MSSYPLPNNIVAKVELEHSLLLKRADGIIEIRCADDFVYDVNHIQENHKYLAAWAENTPLLTLNITGKYTSLTNEARAFLGEGKHKDFIKAEAFLIRSLAQKLLAKFYFKINKPVVPTNYYSFDEKEVAENWLNSLKD